MCLHALWVWAKKLHWNEICSFGGNDGPHRDCQEVLDYAGSRDKGEVVLATFDVHTVHILLLYTFLTIQMACYVVLQVPWEVVTAATLKPKHGVFVKYEHRGLT